MCVAGLAAACAAALHPRRSNLQRACDLGDARACFDLWAADRHDRRCDAVLEARHARALERATAECTRGFPASCVLIWQLDPHAEVSIAPRWLPQLRLEAAHGCGLGLLAECELLASFVSELAGGGANPRLEAHAARQTCQLRGTRCEQLVTLHDTAGRLPDRLALRDALEHACQHRDRTSCSRLSLLYLARDLPEPVAGRGHQLAAFLAR
ncbi:MAG: hypothetical protein WKG01_26295 [Kofleriaceae bacterium]